MITLFPVAVVEFAGKRPRAPDSASTADGWDVAFRGRCGRAIRLLALHGAARMFRSRRNRRPPGNRQRVPAGDGRRNRRAVPRSERGYLSPRCGTDEYQMMVGHFSGCVANGTSPCYSLAESAANMRVIEALYRSARNGGGPVSVTDV